MPPLGFLQKFKEDRFHKKRHQLYNAQQWEELAELCKDFLKHVPYDRKAYHDLAVAYKRLNLPDFAYECCRQIAYNDFGDASVLSLRRQVEEQLQALETGELNVRYLRHYLVLAEIYYEKGLFDQAEEILTALSPLAGHLHQKHILLARIALRNKDYARAALEYERLLEARPDLAQNCRNELERLLQASPESFHLHCMRVDVLKRQNVLDGERSKARGQLDQAPKDLYLRHFLGAAALTLGETEVAQAIYQDLHHDYPGDKNPLRGLAETALKQGDAAQAARHMNTILRQYPGCQAEVDAWYRDANSRHPANVELRAFHAVALLRAGRLDDAKAQYRPLVETYPQREDYRNQWALLEELTDFRRIRELETLLTGKPLEDPEHITLTVNGRKLKLETTEAFRYQAKADPMASGRNVSPEAMRRELEGLCTARGVPVPAAVPSEGTRFESDGVKAAAQQGLVPAASPSGRLSAVAPADMESQKGILYDIAMSYLQGGHPQSALQVFQDLAQLDPHYRDVQAQLSQLKQERHTRRIRKDAPPPEKSQELGAQKQALYDLAQEYRARGLLANAVASLHELMALDPDFGDARELLAQLQAQGAPVPAQGRYINRVLIGKGGMGNIYKAYDTTLKRVVALKELNETYRQDPEALERFQREAAASAAIDHPGIVAVYDIVTGDQPMICMEYIEGRSIRQILRSEAPLDIPRVVDYGLQIAEVLVCIHAQGIIHRDIKPDNVLVKGDGRCKVTDFGLAHLSEASPLTTAGSVLGTTMYMAPEQVRGLAVDDRADIYALGTTLYEMAVGRVPFATGDVSYRQVYEQPTPPRQLVPTVPQALEEIVLRCLEKDPNKRFDSCKALIGSLSELKT